MPLAVSNTLEPAHAQSGVFTPIHHEPGYAYPLVIWLADDGDADRPLSQIMPLLSVRNHIAIDARVVRNQALQEIGIRYNSRSYDDSLTIDRCIKTAFGRFNLRRDKVFLMGQGSGGEKAIQLAWNQPQRFAGIVSIDGGVPHTSGALCGLGLKHRDLPLLLQHISTTSRYSHEQFCDDMRLCHTAGLPATFRHYSEEHDDLSHILADCNRWLMEHIATNLVQ